MAPALPVGDDGSCQRPLLEADRISNQSFSSNHHHHHHHQRFVTTKSLTVRKRLSRSRPISTNFQTPFDRPKDHPAILPSPPFFTMSVIREVTSASLTDAWRTIDIDALQEDSPANFDTSTLHPPLPEVGEADVRALAGQIRQLLRGGDSEGALRGCLEMPVYNGADLAKVCWQKNSSEI